VDKKTEFGYKVCTDEAKADNALRPWYDHEAVNHSVSEYVRDQARTKGIESFWALLKRGHHGTFHHVSLQHLHRYVGEFVGRSPESASGCGPTPSTAPL